ncbi:Gfo/Idh/MocA family oxidoreductase [Amylibacter sp.]|nr:Gfo/Idh/MocA family oxidoreductase [Amylibacter sp.]
MIWLIGAGRMSIDYMRVLKAQDEDVIVIGRGKASAYVFEEKTNHKVRIGGLVSFLNKDPQVPKAAIVSVGIEELYSTSIQLLEYGVKSILVEKPAGLSFDQVKHLKLVSKEKKAEVFIAYNRRFFSSVIKLQHLIEKDGGVTSFNFELTEWSHIIKNLDKSSNILAKWFLGNSTHVADLAFFLGGKPNQISCFNTGKLAWHPSSSIFAGAGISDNGALFNYGADWISAGRWSVEILTNKNRYVLRPMESLQVQNRGSVQLNLISLDDELDKIYKPGLYLQVEAFLKKDIKALCSIDEQTMLFPIYEKMAGYN